MRKTKLPVIEDRTDRRRRCGWRKAGGFYLVANGLAVAHLRRHTSHLGVSACAKLPIPLDVCPTCGNGFAPHRGWKWINGTALAGCGLPGCPETLTYADSNSAPCPLAAGVGRCGLLWIGVRHYPRPADWIAEAAAMGISQRVRTIPRELEIGKTWVMVAHRKAILNADGSDTAAVFQIFRPRAIEYVVADDDPPAKLEALTRRGVTPVRIHRIVDTPMFGTMPADRPPLAAAPECQITNAK